MRYPRLDKALDRKARINDELRRLKTDPNPLPDIDISEVIAAEKRLAEIDQAIAQASRNHAAENERLIMMVAPRSHWIQRRWSLRTPSRALPETTIASLREKQTDERERFDAADRAMTTAREAVQNIWPVCSARITDSNRRARCTSNPCRPGTRRVSAKQNPRRPEGLRSVC